MELKAKVGKKKRLREKIAKLLFPDQWCAPGTKGLIPAQLWEGDASITEQRMSELALRGEKNKRGVIKKEDLRRK